MKVLPLYVHVLRMLASANAADGDMRKKEHAVVAELYTVPPSRVSVCRAALAPRRARDALYSCSVTMSVTPRLNSCTVI